MSIELTVEQALLEDFDKSLKEKITHNTETVVTGAADDYANYKELVGYLRGLTEAKDEFRALVKKYFAN